MIIAAVAASFVLGYLVGTSTREPRDTSRLRLSKLPEASSWLNKKL